MLRKYGKPVDMRMINRNISHISEMIEGCKRKAEKFELRDKTLRKSCIVCGSNDRKLFLTVYEKYKYYECGKCGALTLEKFPDVEEMYLSEETANGNIYIDEDTYDTRINMIAKPKVDFVLDVIGKTGNRIKSWIDIGCGGGELLHYIKELNCGIRGIGLESDPIECEFTKSRNLEVKNRFIDTKNEDIEITELLKEMDVVSFFNVLEHIERPQDYIDYLFRSMKSGAFMVLEVPKHPSLGSFANLTSGDNVYRHIIPPIHLQIFSEKSLEMLLAGKFEIIAIWEFGQGFTDMINNAMILSGMKSCEMYN